MKGWRRVRVVDLCEAHVDCVNRTAPVVDEPTPYKMIRTTNVRGGFIDTESVRYVSEETYLRWTRRLVPRRGDVVLTREAPLGGVGKLRTDDQIFLGQRLYHFRADAKVASGDFLMYALMGPDLQDQIRSFGSGFTVEHMRLPDIEKLELDAPDVREQRRIAGILSAYDDLIENCERRIRVLDEMARALYREWFVLFRYPGHEKTPLVDSPLGRIPRGWRLDALASVAAVNARQLDLRRPPEKIRYIDISSVSPGTVESTTEYEFTDAPGRARRIVRHGDVLWSCVRPNRRSHALVLDPAEATIASTGFAVLSAEKLPYSYLYATTTTDDFVSYLEKRATGAAYPAVTAKVFEDAPVLVPTSSVLDRFAATADPGAATIALLRRRVENLRKTRDLLLPRLLSGELSVGDAA